MNRLISHRVDVRSLAANDEVHEPVRQTHWLDRIYVDVCKAYNRQPNEVQNDAWIHVLGRYTEADVTKAIVAWQGCTDVDVTSGKIKGSFFPQPADIKAIVERQTTRASSARFRACSKCEFGWARDEATGKVRRCQCWLDWLAKARSADGKP